MGWARPFKADNRQMIQTLGNVTLAVISVIVLAACATSADPSSTATPAQSAWLLTPPNAPNTRVTLVRGMAVGEVTRLFGSPEKVRTRPGAVQEWTYKRRFHDGASITTGSVGSENLTALQKVTYLETIRIRFENDLLATVTTTHKRERMSSSVPYDRT